MITKTLFNLSILKTVFLILTIYLVLNIFIYLLLPHLLFPVPKNNPNVFENEIAIEGDKGKISCYLKKNGTQRLIIFIHGNAESLAMLSHFLDHYSSATGYSVLSYDYPGYGNSEGKPSINGLTRSMKAVVDYAIDSLGYAPHQLIFHGRSLGTYPALWGALNYSPGGLILESGFSSLPEIVFPINPFLFTGINNKNIAKRIHVPTLIFHGSRDNIIPVRHADILYKSLGSHKKKIIIKKGSGHNDMYSSSPEAYFRIINNFLSDLQIPINGNF